ncbi:MAG: HAMP domain-containing protein [Beijerinckiaceae bacterium]|nr:HAMP domain-containing protein [Beijerinckiaceae bacterium]
MVDHQIVNPTVLHQKKDRAVTRLSRRYTWLRQQFSGLLPKGLYARSLIIIIAPIIVLQAVVAYFFMERHWRNVTGRLSQGLAGEIAMIIDLHRADPSPEATDRLVRTVKWRLGHDISFTPPETLPPANQPHIFLSFLDNVLGKELIRQIRKPFWVDSVKNSSEIEIRIDLGDGILKVVTRRSQAYASNAHIFLLWMVGSSLVLIVIAVLFLRNQIRPILRLSDAAESFGKGRDIDFRPRGAREVRQAGRAFIEMKRRIERAMDQRTAMLNGVSHDLRTVLTRFRLSVEMMEDGPEKEPMRKDVNEMGRMLEAYLAFARGDASESAVELDFSSMLDDLKRETEAIGTPVSVEMSGEPIVKVRPDAFKRMLSNLVANAARFGSMIELRASHDARWLTVTVDDDGPGIPASNRDEVFRPFVRLDEARNQDESGTGLGLSIARDIARNHGGDIVLGESPMGGLRAIVRVPA